jgi:predicted nucleotidyltransferase component of viral defense system
MNSSVVVAEFLSLPLTDQADILRTLSPQLGKSPLILEKDLWVCWTLKNVFSMPGAHKTAFKGGTSLSKVFDAIQRFSEDLDLTIDYTAFTSVNLTKLNSKAKKRLSDQLKTSLASYLQETVVPYLQHQLAMFNSSSYHLELNTTGDQIRVFYPSSVDVQPYLSSSVLLEFGARNTTEPNEHFVIRPYLSDAAQLGGLSFPEAQVTVLAPERTFWEKVTLVHVECHRDFRESAERLSRHWYDLFQLADHEIGRRALTRRDLLEAVVNHKKIFFNASYANYDACLQGGLRLVPGDGQREGFARDYQKMQGAGMLYGTVPTFEAILERLTRLEADINAAA